MCEGSVFSSIEVRDSNTAEATVTEVVKVLTTTSSAQRVYTRSLHCSRLCYVLVE